METIVEPTEPKNGYTRAIPVCSNFRLSALLCSALLAVTLRAQTPDAKRLTEKGRSAADSKAKKAEQPASPKQPLPDPRENVPPPVV